MRKSASRFILLDVPRGPHKRSRLLESARGPGLRSLRLRCGCSRQCAAASSRRRYRSWADAGWGNNNLISALKSVSQTIFPILAEQIMASKMKPASRADILRGYNTAVLLCAKICKERGWDPLAKLSNGMYLISSHNEGRLAGLSSAHVDPDHVWSTIRFDHGRFPERP